MLRSNRPERIPVIAGFILSVAFLRPAFGASIAESNQITNLPMFGAAATTCTATLQFKPVRARQQHAYIIVKGPDGKVIELRAGPAKGGPSGTVPGQISPSAGDQPTGNPFNCAAINEWGAIITYIGPHGPLGTDVTGSTIYSPDGNVATPTATVPLNKGAQADICKLANCMMTVLQAAGRSCKAYMNGSVRIRNSNTAISMSLSACGVDDPRPTSISAPGWGEVWE